MGSDAVAHARQGRRGDAVYGAAFSRGREGAIAYWRCAPWPTAPADVDTDDAAVLAEAAAVDGAQAIGDLSTDRPKDKDAS